MNSMFKAAVICLGTLATVSAADAMPALSQFADTPAVVTNGGAQVEKALVVVRHRRPVIRHRVIIRHRARPVVRRTVRKVVRHL